MIAEAPAAPYAVEPSRQDGVRTVVLRDEAAGVEATLAPSAGMLVSSLRHGGDELLWQGDGIAGYVREGAFMGVPFLHPWANRLGGLRYDVDGRGATLDPESPLVTLDGCGQPIHGLLRSSPHWDVRRARVTSGGARLYAELDFGARPELVAAFPFPHRVAIDVLLREGELTVRTILRPTAGIAVPVAFGFHPYLQLPGVAREAWEVALPVMSRMELDGRMIPTGRSTAVEPSVAPLGARSFDDAFDGLRRPARFALSGGGRTVALELGRGFGYAQVFSPPGAPFVCFEPMTAPADALRSGTGLARVAPGREAAAAYSIRIAAT